MSASIGSSTAQKFILPSNSSTATTNSVLTINASTKATTWAVIPTQISNYTNYDNTAKTLISNVSGTPTTITDLVMSASIGSSTAQKFILPSNSSTATTNSVLTIDSTTKATTWAVIPTQISNYTNYDNTAKTLISNVSGTPTTITDLVMSASIGSSTAQKFILPSNSSTATTNSVLTINASTKATTWAVIPTQISNYVNYSNPNLISNVSGTPTTISTLNIGALTCTTINTQSSDINCGSGAITCHTITASSNLVSTGGIIVYNGTNNTATVQQDGQITCKNFLIRQPGTNNYPLSISGTGDVLGNGADFSRLQTIELNIFNTLSAGVFGTLQASINNAGLLTCKGVNAGSSIIQTLSGVNCQYTDISGIMYSRGIEIRNALNTASLTVNTNGNLNTSGNINCAIIDVGNTVYCRYLGVRDVGNTFDIIKLNQNGTINANIVSSTIFQSGFYESNPVDTGSIDIGVFNTSGNINIAQNNTTGNINIGNGGLIGVSQKIVFKRPLTIQYLIPSDYTYIGGTQAVTNFSLAVPNNTIKTIGTLTNVPGGNYMIFYSVEYTFLLSTKTFTLQQYGITSTLDSFSTIYGKCYDLETTSQIRTANVGGNSRFTKTFSNLITVIGTTSNIRLTVGLSYNTTENVTVNGSIKLMRIG
jgi:hypothetical protein